MSDKTDAAVEAGVAGYLHPVERVYAVLIASASAHRSRSECAERT
jgi:hypothetical protein